MRKLDKYNFEFPGLHTPLGGSPVFIITAAIVGIGSVIAAVVALISIL